MVNANLMDAIDEFLRLNGRDARKPFGGAQVVLFGDPYQLPPVLSREDEAKFMEFHYRSPFFWDAKVFEQLPITVVELRKKRVMRKAKYEKRATAVELSGAWATLRDRLAEAFGVLEEGQYLVLSGTRSPYYVQFAMEADSLLWSEAVSDAFLEKGQKLGKARKNALVELGWRAPADGSRGKKSHEESSGSPNYQGRSEGHDQFEAAATLAVQTFRDVYGFRKPTSLRYHAFEGEGTDILLPTLGIGRERASGEEAVEDVPATLEEEVLEVVRDGLGAEDARFDRNGFLTLEVEGEFVSVLLLDSPPCVRLFTPILLDVPNEDETLDVLNTLNFEGRHARFVLDEGSVLAVIDVPCEPFVPDHFAESFLALASAAHELPESLRDALGGRLPSKPKPAGDRGREGKRTTLPS